MPIEMQDNATDFNNISVSRSDARKMSFRMIYSSLFAMLSAFLFGLSLTVTCAYFDDLVNAHTNGAISETTGLQGKDIGTICSILPLGALVTSLCNNMIRLTTRTKLIISSILYAVGIGIMTVSPKFMILALGKALCGFAIGFSSTNVSPYLDSIAPVELRAVFGACMPLSIVMGLGLGNLLSHFFQDSALLPLYGSAAAAALHIPFLFGIKDTPVQASSSSVISLLSNRQARKSVILSCVTHLAQQLSCINGIVVYLDSILKDYGDQKYLYGTYVYIVSILVTLVSMLVLDKFGRKFLLLTSSLIASIGLGLLAFEFKPLISCIIFIFGFNLGLGPVPWMLTNDIFPEEHRGAASTIGVSVNWLANSLTVLAFGYLFSFFGNMRYLVYIAGLFFCWLYILLNFKETKGKTPAFQ